MPEIKGLKNDFEFILYRNMAYKIAKILNAKMTIIYSGEKDKMGKHLLTIKIEENKNGKT